MRRRHAEVVYARQGGKMHVAGNARQASRGAEVGRCGMELWGDTVPARLVPEAERCRARACAAAWPPVLQLVAGGG